LHYYHNMELKSSLVAKTDFWKTEIQFGFGFYKIEPSKNLTTNVKHHDGRDGLKLQLEEPRMIWFRMWELRMNFQLKDIVLLDDSMLKAHHHKYHHEVATVDRKLRMFTIFYGMLITEQFSYTTRQQ